MLINKDIDQIAVSATQPINGEELWIQKGKNLFDKDNANIVNLYPASSATISSNLYKSVLLKCKPNTTYTASYDSSISGDLIIASYSAIPSVDVMWNVRNVDPQNNIITITTGANDKYLLIYVYYGSTISQNILDSLQVEQNSSVTTYEAYIDKKIYTKNDNGAYDEFYNDIWEDITSQITMQSGYTLVRGKLYKKGKQIIGNLTVSGTFTSGQISTIMKLPYRTSAAHMDYCGFSNSDWSVKNIGYLYYDQDVIVSPNTTSQTHVIVDFNYITK